MEFDDQSIDFSGVDDRRGSGLGGLGGGGIAIGGGGLGIVGLIAYLVMGVLGGSSGSGFTLPGDTGFGGQDSRQAEQDLQQRCTTDGALQKYTDCRLVKIFNIADDVWSEQISRGYSAPRLTFFTSAVNTGCGRASSSTGPFYCPADARIYFDLRFLEQLQRQFGAQGQFAQAYIVAHEFGHHIQNLTGTERQVRRMQQLTGKDNAYSVGLELQADCYAGVWSTLADRRGENGIALQRKDVAEALRAAQAVGDDRIQEQTSGSVDPESFTHGSAADRVAWFQRGLDTGDPSSCTTFSERGLSL